MTLRSICILLALVAPLTAQSNVIEGLDLKLGSLGSVSAMSREGTYPHGKSGVAMSTTSCNTGAVDITWLEAMDPNHPFIAFLIARENASNGRMVQISDRSYCKHNFYALTDSLCDQCSKGPFGSGGDKLGVGCSDTYATYNNGDNYWLGPPDEIDPWLGLWDPVCSHFDKGEPAVPPPFDCDGFRSLTSMMAANLGDVVGHRIRINDGAAQPGLGAFWYQANYVVKGEASHLRDDNLGSRKITPGWNGNDVTFSTSEPLVHGSILQRWSGATVAQAGAHPDDGTFYVAVKVTGPTKGLYHYEYAVHNRDNSRGGGALRIPICAGAQVLDAGFSDLDGNPSNDWSITSTGAELVFSTAADPVHWNTFFNFWFDSDAAPLPGAVTVDHFSPGPGAAGVSVASSAPLALYNVSLGPGCATGDAPDLYATGAPAQATLGNQSFGLESSGHGPLAPALLHVGALDGDVDLGGGCHLYMGGLGTAASWTLMVGSADEDGVASFGLPIPNNPGLEGSSANFQVVSLPTGGGPLLGIADLSAGLRVRSGDSVPSCP